MESELENFRMKNLNKTKNDSIDRNNSAENDILDDLVASENVKKRTYDDKLAFPMRLNFKSELIQKVSSFHIFYNFFFFFSISAKPYIKYLSIILDKVTITEY